MAINVYEKLSEKNAPKSSCSKSSNLSLCHTKLDYTTDGSTISCKNDNSVNKKSPYLMGDKIKMHSRVTERKLVRKKTDFVSSFPLAVNIYKANSDEFKVIKPSNKKIRKSVLTIPNDPAPVPQMCTVSDMTESDYCNENKEGKPKPRKKRSIQNNKKHRKIKNVDVYDRDARYCSQLDIDLNSSSTDFINQFNGDGKKRTRRLVQPNKTEIRAHDVWAILRNLNQFQFVPSPPMSQGSIVSAKKTKIKKIRRSCRDARLIETCRTEEFAYISNFVDNSHSQSSIDRITVIDKQEDDYQEICKEIKNCETKFYRQNQKKNKSKTIRKHNLKVNNSNNMGNNRFQINQEQSSNVLKSEKDQRYEVGVLNIRCGNEKSKHQTPQKNQGDFKFSDDFDSSQTNLTENIKIYNNIQDKNKLHKNVSKTQVNGITKVFLSKGNNITNKKMEILRRSPDLVSLPVRIPIAHDGQQQRLKRGKLMNNNSLKTENNVEIKIDRPKQCYINPASVKNKPNNETKVILESEVVNEVKSDFNQKRQLKDKTLQLLYKKTKGDDCNTQEVVRGKVKKIVNSSVDFGTNTQMKVNIMEEANISKSYAKDIRKTSPTVRRSWTKCKWASDFIDSVIKNLRSGVYYNNEKTSHKSNHNKIEDFCQTEIDIENTFIEENHQQYMRPKFLTTGEELFKIFYQNNSSKFKKKPFYTNQADKKLTVADVMLHNKSKLPVQIGKGRSKNVNFGDIVYNAQVNYRVPDEHKILIQRNEAVNGFSTVKQTRVDGERESDFIDNVFRKIKNGIYYSQDENCLCRKHYSHTIEDSSQTENYCPKLDYDEIGDLDLITDKNLIHDSLILIPGFDDTSNELEIETISKKQIAVKNCVTNVIVQFDVELPSDQCQGLQLKQSFSCIPIAVTENQTKIFKSKTTIINAFLPAELCSILPKVMRRLIATNSKFNLPKITVGKVESNLSTISELTRCESPEFVKQISCEFNESKAPDIMNIQRLNLFNCVVKPMALFELKSNEPKFKQINNSTFNHKNNYCMALQIYQSKKKIVPAYAPFNLENYIENLIYTRSLSLILKMPITVNYFKILCYNNYIGINVEFKSGLSNINVKLVFSNAANNSLSNNLNNSIECDKNISNRNNVDPQNTPKELDTVKSTLSTSITEIRRNGSEFQLNNSKNKKRSFTRLYRKCKSMSNLSNNRSTSSIDKITSTDDFVLALGSSKVLFSVIDGNTERKILLSLKQMKNWMSDITPRQALLVLLLANKKDTPNVVRYRPVVLQGIAVNRITRASELDMEIEVIERENLNKLNQFEGISYLPASVENQDTLLEELYWIAKTTASDYQKPFDESSERLLKSLLEKRKKLNPSYLRVMARYVGLGLLKSSK